MAEQPSVSVLGAGNWGTTVAHLIGNNGFPVRLWARSQALRTIQVIALLPSGPWGW